MIIDSLANYKMYCSINPLFEKSFEFVLNNIDTLEDGKYEIEGDNAFVMFVTTNLKEEKNAALEAHDKYIDIQIPYSRCEGFGVKDRARCNSVRDNYNEVKDIIFYNDEKSNIVVADKGDFVVFFPNDAHAPCIGEGEIRKIIIKVRA